MNEAVLQLRVAGGEYIRLVIQSAGGRKSRRTSKRRGLRWAPGTSAAGRPGPRAPPGAPRPPYLASGRQRKEAPFCAASGSPARSSGGAWWRSVMHCLPAGRGTGPGAGPRPDRAGSSSQSKSTHTCRRLGVPKLAPLAPAGAITGAAVAQRLAVGVVDLLGGHGWACLRAGSRCFFVVSIEAGGWRPGKRRLPQKAALGDG